MVEKIKKKGSVLVCETPSRTQQHFKSGCDINEIYNSYCKRNIPLPIRNSNPLYGEISVTSLLEAQELIDTVNDEFYSLSPEIRNKFDNDPVKLVEFVGNTDNITAAIELGLIPRPTKEYTDDIDVHSENCSAVSEPLPNHLSLTGKGDTLNSENVVQTTISTDVQKNM